MSRRRFAPSPRPRYGKARWKDARMEDEPPKDGDEQDALPESLLPYDTWTEDALRQVAMRAVAHVAAHGLPGEHHFYLTFRTDQAGVVIPTRLLAQYPQEMTIVLQHQFWDLKVDEQAGSFSVTLSFSGIPTTLTIPFSAMVAFADPAVRFGLRFRNPPETETEEEVPPEEKSESTAEEKAPAKEKKPEEAGDETPQVVSLDAFRRRTPKD